MPVSWNSVGETELKKEWKSREIGSLEVRIAEYNGKMLGHIRDWE